MLQEFPTATLPKGPDTSNFHTLMAYTYWPLVCNRICNIMTYLFETKYWMYVSIHCRISIYLFIWPKLWYCCRKVNNSICSINCVPENLAVRTQFLGSWSWFRCSGSGEKSLASARNQTTVLQLSSPQPTHYIDCAILGPFFIRKPMGRAKYILKMTVKCFLRIQ